MAPGLYVRHPSSFRHETGAHPENPRRLAAIEEALSERDWMGLDLVEAPAVSREDLLRVHDERHIDSIRELAERGGGMIDMDTVASEGSWEAARHSAGGAVQAVDRLLGPGKQRPGGNGPAFPAHGRGATDRPAAGLRHQPGRTSQSAFAFCGLRPPGHHAERGKAMGFCLFNNVAVAAAHAIAERGAERVLVLDWDVHHGNGTEAIFYGSSEVLYASIHQSPLYPGTGAPSDTGTGEGEGYTVNLPVPPGSGPDEFLSLVQHVVAPIAREFRPGLLCISAGYDAHRDDPLANCELDEAAFADMAAAMRMLGEELGAPVLACLEGGYSLGALAASVPATIEALAGDREPREAPAEPAASAREHFARHWESLA
jgi:acetoin utilization deacetylase AcuC-like enzyme